MKVQGTKPVKNDDGGDRPQKEDPAHKVEWKQEIEAACEKVFHSYDQTTHLTPKQLFDEVCDEYGEWLDKYARPDRQKVYMRIAKNVLIAAKKKKRFVRRFLGVKQPRVD